MPIDRRIEAQTRRLKRRQHAAASWEQLLQVGWTRSQIATRVERSEWQRPFPHVYILGDPALVPLAMESAVLLSLGEDAALSRRTSGFLWGLLGIKPHLIDVIVTRTAVRPRPGVRIHLSRSLDAKDLRFRHGLQVTSPARTIIDLAIDSPGSEIEHAAGEAVARRLMTDHDLDHTLRRVPRNHPGAARLRARLHADPEFLMHTQSVAERIAYPLIIDAGLPCPRLNRYIEGLKVDMHWPDHNVIVEVDGFDFHSSRTAFENDRRRDQILTAAGYTVIRITWKQLNNESHRVIATIAQALARSQRQAA